MAYQRHRRVSGDRPQRIAGQSDYTILNVDADRVERIAIAHAIILQLPHNFLLQLRVGDLAGPGNLQIVTNRDYVLGSVRSFIDLFFGSEVLDGAFKIDDPIRNRYLYALNFFKLLVS